MAEAQPELTETKNNKTTGKQETPQATGTHELAPAMAAEPVDEAGQPETATPAAAEPPISEVDGLRQELENLKQQLADSRDRALRIQAEMDNLRKRTARDVEHAHRYALDRFVGELLPVLDSLELGISSGNTNGGLEALREGMDLTAKKFLSTLEKFGVTVVEPQGDKFNPEKHEAVTMQVKEGAAAGTVIAVLQKGYELNGRLVRPAMVIVAK